MIRDAAQDRFLDPGRSLVLVVTGVASLHVAAPASDRCEYPRMTGALRRHRGVVPAQAPRFWPDDTCECRSQNPHRCTWPAPPRPEGPGTTSPRQGEGQCEEPAINLERTAAGATPARRLLRLCSWWWPRPDAFPPDPQRRRTRRISPSRPPTQQHAALLPLDLVAATTGCGPLGRRH